MTIEDVIQLLQATESKPLTTLQELILRQAWEGKTYTAIAQEAFYGAERVRKVAARLWSLLSQVIEEPITKTNFRRLLESRPLTSIQYQLIQNSHLTFTTLPEFPDSPIPPDSPFYIPRSPIEELAEAEITEPGSVIRIIAPRKMGKSSLMLRLLDHAVQKSYQTVNLDLRQADDRVFTSLDKFLRWFCANISRELNRTPQLDEYWDYELGSKVSCSVYFQHYILESIPTSLVLGFNEFDRIFKYPEITSEFLPLIRLWSEQAKSTEIWQKLRMVVSHSTEIYIPLKLMQSPFNIGLPLTLPPLTPKQVQALALRYGLEWVSDTEIRQLMEIVGGHPYLIQLALYYFKYSDSILLNQQPYSATVAPVSASSIPTDQQQQLFTRFIRQAATESGIYSDYLRGLLSTLNQEPQLGVILKQMLLRDRPIELEPLQIHQLKSLGIIKLEGDRATLSCDLYRQYFSKYLLSSEPRVEPKVALHLAQPIQYFPLRSLPSPEISYIDDLTEIISRYSFDYCLQREWRRAAREQQNLSLIFGDVDFFQLYNDLYGQLAGDRCLQKIAQVIQNSTLRPADVVARYRDEEFVVALPGTGIEGAIHVAERIREQVIELAIPHSGSPVRPPVVTISLGVASTVPQGRQDTASLVEAANHALNEAKVQGRNRVTLGEVVEA
ncbi:MAG: AAA-like domain-containing protein [Microcoleaceae cyanobacterium]